jgi:hypothetical protein
VWRSACGLGSQSLRRMGDRVHSTHLNHSSQTKTACCAITHSRLSGMTRQKVKCITKFKN